MDISSERHDTSIKNIEVVKANDVAQTDKVKSTSLPSENEYAEDKPDEQNDGHIVQRNSSFEEVFRDPSTFDFLLKIGNSNPLSDLRKESLYLKFDPCLASFEAAPQDSGLLKPNVHDTTVPIDKAGCSSDLPPMLSYGIGKLLDIKDEEEYEESSSIFPNTDSFEKHSATLAVERDLQIKPNSSLPVKDICKIPDEKIISMKTELFELRNNLVKRELEHREKINHLKMILQRSTNEDIKKNEDQALYHVVMKQYEEFITFLVIEKQEMGIEFEKVKQHLQEEIIKVKGHQAVADKAYADLMRKDQDIENSTQTLSIDKVKLMEQKIKFERLHYEQKENVAANELNMKILFERVKEEVEKVKQTNNEDTLFLENVLRARKLKEDNLKQTLENLRAEHNKCVELIDEIAKKKINM